MASARIAFAMSRTGAEAADFRAVGLATAVWDSMMA
jgi:hypothetical protein